LPFRAILPASTAEGDELLEKLVDLEARIVSPLAATLDQVETAPGLPWLLAPPPGR
jgi:hypothetical protein